MARAGERWVLAGVSLMMVVMGGPAMAQRSCRVLTPILPGNQGTLNASEVLTLASAAFDLTDRDRNTVVDGEELAGRMTVKEIGDDDPDKDGTLDKGEYLAAADARFNVADANKDNAVSCREMRTVAGAALLRLLMK